jgi:hypothetical protein
MIELNHVLFATDFSDEASNAKLMAHDLCVRFSADLHILQGAFPFCVLVLCVYAGVCEDLVASSDFRVMDWGVQFQSGR